MELLKNIFGVKATPPKIQLELSDAEPPINSMVEQVHREFFTASEKLLSEVNTILSNNVIAKAERLQRFGFGNVPEVHKAHDLIRNKQTLELIQHYQILHPNNKVITWVQVENICKKYGLIHAEIRRFKGFVPDKNLKEIEAFQKLQDKRIQQIRKSGTIQDDGRRNTEKMGSISNALTICAPQKDMIIESWEKVKNGKILVPDPVVLFAIENKCYLIVTAWGEEASDPLIANEKMN